MRTITSSSVSLGKILACLSALRSVTLPIPLLSNILKFRPCRPQMHIFPFLDAHLAVLRCTSFHRTPLGGSIATAQWQRYHRPVAMLPPSGVRWKDGHLRTAGCLFANG